MSEETDKVRVLQGVRINGEHQAEGEEVETSVNDAALVVGLGKAEYVDSRPRIAEVHQDPASPAGPASPFAPAVSTNPQTTTSPTERTETHDPHAAIPAGGEQANFTANTTEQPAVKVESTRTAE